MEYYTRKKKSIIFTILEFPAAVFWVDRTIMFCTEILK